MEQITPIPTNSPPRRRPSSSFFGRQFLAFSELVEIGLAPNRPTLRAMIKAGRFPPPIYLGPRMPRWDVVEIEELLGRLKAARDQDRERAIQELGFLKANRARRRKAARPSP
jgi:predicted DNA-binding transcriptional regulator AlpA